MIVAILVVLDSRYGQVLYFAVPSVVSLNAQALCDGTLTSNARDCV